MLWRICENKLEQIKNDITCKHVVTNIISVLHSNRVMPFIGSDTDAQTSALLDRDDFIVDSVITHRGNAKKVSSLEFLIRWSNYSSAHDSWQPWAEMKKVLRRGIGKKKILYIGNMHFSSGHAYICEIYALRSEKYCIETIRRVS